MIMNILFTLKCFGFLLFCDGYRFPIGRCKPDLENGYYKEHQKGEFNYACDDGHVSNIPGLQKMGFRCEFIWEFGYFELKATSSKFLQPFGPIYLRNITCQPKRECLNPPLPRNMVRNRTVQYEEAVAHMGMDEHRSRFFSGDTFDYRCQDGYSSEYVESFVSSEYTYDYGTEEAEAEETISRSITCDESGKWNGQEDYELRFEKCEEIVCDASRFSDMRNGNITDYKPSYNFREEMRLVCNEGYKPKNRISVVKCTKTTSFDQIALPSFGCEPIKCLGPASPKNGLVRLQGVYVGDKAYFHCNSGYNLIGSAEWTCLPNGKWDATCTRCESQDSRSHCPAPCIPIGADIISAENKFFVGSVLEFICKSGGEYFGGSKKRTCMKDRNWSGTPIDCTGDSLYDGNVGVTLLKALEKQVPDNSIADNNDPIASKTINVGQMGGVDVYFLVDVSGSIDDVEFNATKRFINAVLPKLGISDDYQGTRLVFYYFATKSKNMFGMSHYNDWQQFDSYSHAQQRLESTQIHYEIKQEIGSGTSISAALKDIVMDLQTKAVMVSTGRYRQAQQVIILLSDGVYNTNGNPKQTADILKNVYEVEIYSIFVGDVIKDKIGYNTMKEIASKRENEEHFFAIKYIGDFDDVLDKMIEGAVDISCGMTQERLTKLKKNSPQYEHEARKHAWPWMVDLRWNMDHVCGGSLIDEQWVLTAAHCLEGFQRISRVHLKKSDQTQLRNFIEIPVAESDYHIHPKYDSTNIPSRKYNIALIKLPQRVQSSPSLLPVCLWNKEIQEMSYKDYDDYFKPGTYGVVTGWGVRSQYESRISDRLKQMQMSVQSPDECIRNLTTHERKEVDKDVMFCAGGNEVVNGELKYIDTCRGDSGGPFVVEHPRIENKYIQTGIVSFGFGCKQPGKYGFYTKLTEELLEWIQKTIADNDN